MKFIKILTIWIFGFTVGFSIGLQIGIQYGQSNAKIECIKKSPGYTVIDAERVVNQDGDTLKLEWNKPKMRK